MELEDFIYGMEHNDYFEHHGVKGQKWGVRRKRLSGVSGGVGGENKINRLQKKYEESDSENRSKNASRYLTTLSYREAEARYNANKYSAKANQALAKGKNKKAEKLMQKRTNNLNVSSDMQKRIDSTISNLNKQKVKTVMTNAYAKHPNTKHIVAAALGGSFLLGPIGAVAGGAAVYNFASPKLKSKIYTVK